mmetsp:Transcript_19805/g.32261  ORF Transcript_19805/g.32261 Transcript_19805/m.32261 type:complete len:216 (+) Transcript_19805:326-973(+)
MEPQRFDFFILEQAILKNFLRPQFITTVYQGHLGGKIGQKQRLFHSGVATTDNHNLLTAVEEPVAGRTSRNAKAFKGLFALQPQPLGPRTGTEDHGIGSIERAAIAFGLKRALAQVEVHNHIANDLTAHRAGVLFHLHHQLRTLNLHKGWPVFHLSGGGQLPTRLHALHQHRLQHRAARINARSIARRSGANNQNLGVFCLGHERHLSALQSLSR